MITNTEDGRFDFDAWARLAKEDPEGFERMRRLAVEQAIARAPHARQERLRRLQWRVDQVRRLSGSPLGACIRISNMMWDTVLGDDGLVESINRLAAVKPGVRRGGPPKRSARVVSLAARRAMG